MKSKLSIIVNELSKDFVSLPKCLEICRALNNGSTWKFGNCFTCEGTTINSHTGYVLESLLGWRIQLEGNTMKSDEFTADLSKVIPTIFLGLSFGGVPDITASPREWPTGNMTPVVIVCSIPGLSLCGLILMAVHKYMKKKGEKNTDPPDVDLDDDDNAPDKWAKPRSESQPDVYVFSDSSVSSN